MVTATASKFTVDFFNLGAGEKHALLQKTKQA